MNLTWNLGFCPDNTTMFEILFTLWGFFCTNLLTLTSHETFNRCPTYTEFIVSCLNPDLMCNGANKNEGAATSAEMSGFVLQNAIIEFYGNKIRPTCRLFALLWSCIIFDLRCFHTFFKVAFLCSLLSHCISCTNGKIWEPSGGRNNICKSHSALSTSAWSSDRVKLCWSCIISMFHHLFLFLSVYLCT